MLKWIDRYIQKDGWAPTVRDIQAGLSLSSTSAVAYWLDILEGDNYIEREAKRAGRLRITAEGYDALREIDNEQRSVHKDRK